MRCGQIGVTVSAIHSDIFNPGAMMANRQDQFGTQLLTLINVERTRRGLTALELSEPLDQVSDDYAQRMGDEDFFAHTDPITGTKPRTSNMSMHQLWAKIWWDTRLQMPWLPVV